jgi:peptidoglycan/xylan/chitin deacetylase (PgdA/CDA1 family)
MDLLLIFVPTYILNMKTLLFIGFFLFATYSFAEGIIRKHLPEKLVILTFDDATANQYSVVAPLLKEYGFGATFFICEFPPNFADTSKYMNWRQICELDRMGFEIANHTRNHPSIGKLKDDKILEQLNYIERKCDSMKITQPTTFAYPGYSLSPAVLKILEQKGYEFARAGGSRVYEPLIDHPLLVPSWAMNSQNKQQIMEAFESAHDGDIVVLTIHGVPDTEHPWVNTPPELFKSYLKYLSENNYTVIPLRDLNKYIRTKKAMKDLIPDFNKKLKN